jgi:hypothetical protein
MGGFGHNELAKPKMADQVWQLKWITLGLGGGSLAFQY